MPDNSVYEDVDDEDFYSYQGPSYLGASGITRHCVRGMASILTSPFRPSKLTLVSSFEFNRVCFFVWDWPSQGKAAIVADGFGCK